jgi:hypothetical protein
MRLATHLFARLTRAAPAGRLLAGEQGYRPTYAVLP